MRALTGIIPALVTPFQQDGSVDYQSLQDHVQSLLKKGVDGFYVCGSTGEAFLMNIAERKKVLEAVVEANQQTAKIICHCGAISTETSIELAKHAAQLNVDAISSVPPFYYHFSQAEIINYYYALANASSLPLIVYNIPSLSSVTVTPEMMGRLCKNHKIRGLKFTSNDFYAMEQIKTAHSDLYVYNGFDEMALAGFSMGADGAIGSTFNVLAEYFVELWNLFKANRNQEALAIQQKVNAMIAKLLETGKLFACLKYLITLGGIPYGECRKPFDKLSDADKQTCEELFNEIVAEKP